jgi:hypothetical protein
MKMPRKAGESHELIDGECWMTATCARHLNETAPDLKTFTTLDGDIISRRDEIEDELDDTIVGPLDRS